MSEPDFASVEMEKKMEEQNVLEEDRDEVRRFAGFLSIQKNKDGRRVVSKEMHDWLTGEDVQP